MAAPTEQDIIALQNAVEQLQQAQADTWWHGLLIALEGGAIAAIPTIWIAYISKKSEKEMFQMNKEKEESVIKSKLFGEIKVVEHTMYIFISDMIRLYVEYVRRRTINERNPQAEYRDVVINKLDEYEDMARQYINKKGEFSRVIYEYNYFVRDERIDTMLEEFNKMTFPVNIGIEEASFEELAGLTIAPIVKHYETTQYVRFSSAIESIVNHIMDSKK